MFYASLTEVKLKKCACSLLLFDIPSIGREAINDRRLSVSLSAREAHSVHQKNSKKHAHVTL